MRSQRLGTAWQLAAAGKRQIVWIAGEAGVGKTTLIERFMAEVGDIHCAHGQCVEQYGDGEPYLPVLEALTALCRRDAGLVELIRAVAPTWLLQLPWLSSAAEREALRRELTGTGQVRMLREMGELLDRYTADRPLLLVTEDLHWSDQATVQLIDYVARRRSPALDCCGSRASAFRKSSRADHPLAAVRQELRLHRLCDEIVLDAFSEREVGEYVAAHVPALAAETRHSCARCTIAPTACRFSSPTWSNDLVAGEHGRLERVDARTRLAVDADSGHAERASSNATWSSSNPSQRSLLEAASVCGVELRLPTVAQALGRDVASVAESCAELARRQRWLREVTPAQQAAALDAAMCSATRCTGRCSTSASAGALASNSIARWQPSLERERAEGRNVSAAELASHFELGREPMAALRYYAEAAESALLHFSPAQTMSLTERALALLPQTVHSDGADGSGDDAHRAARHRSQPDLGLHLERREAGLRARAGAARRRAAAPAARAGPLRAGADALPERRSWRAADDHRATQRIPVAGERRPHGADLRLPRARIGRARSRTAAHRARVAGEGHPKPCEALDASTAPAVFAADPAVITLGLLALELLHLGFVDQGRARMRAASARALALREPAPQMAALWLEAMFEQRVGNAERVADLAERLLALVEEYALPDGRGRASVVPRLGRSAARGSACRLSPHPRGS